MAGTVYKVSFPNKMGCKELLWKEIKHNYPDIRYVSDEALEYVIQQSAESLTSLRAMLMKVMAQTILDEVENVNLELTEALVNK